MKESIKEYLSRIGTQGGKTKSPSKSHSSRENGKKGGRPVIPVDIDMLTEDLIPIQKIRNR